MLKNYFLIAIRQFSRHKMFSALNVFCLAIGISFCLLIGQYVLHEKSVNADLKNADRQYFLTSDWKIKNTGPEITTVGPLPKILKTNYPSLVSNFYRFNPVTTVLSAGDKHFREDVAIGDTTLISMYRYRLLYGDPAHAFVNNTSAVITEALALKLFGDKNAIHKTVTMTNNTGTLKDYQVTAVLKTLKYNSVNYLLSDKGYSMFVPFEGNEFYPRSGPRAGTGEEDWNGFFTVGYVELQPGIKPEQLRDPVKKLLALNCPEFMRKNLEVRLNPLSSYYFKANNRAIEKMLSILSLVALGILLLAVINFVNIMIGTSSYRIKEMGLRKVFGGRRKELLFQFLIESLVLTGFSALLSIVFYTLARSLFNEVLHTHLPTITEFQVKEILLLLLLVLIVGCLAGLYPAIVLSGSEMVSSVKGKSDSVEKRIWMRKSLLVLQFTIAIAVFIFSMTISRQVTFFFNTDLGYNKDQLLVISAFPKQWDSAGVVKMESIRDGLLRSSVVKDATVSFEVPERTSPGQIRVVPVDSKNKDEVSIQFVSVDDRYGSTFGLHLMEGRFLRDHIGGFVSGEAVINESAMKSFGWKTAVGHHLQIVTGGQLTIVGVVKDFHMASMHESIGPLALTHVKDSRAYRYLTVKLQGENPQAQVEKVKAVWQNVSPGSPFDYFFMDERVQAMYESELQLQKAAAIATGLMLLIVLLGIFGVLTLALTKRNKEIAVRKVLGAEVHHILSLFIGHYLGLLLIANAIAWPITYYLSNQWLNQYAYRIVQPVSVYVTSGICVAAIAIVLISLQCLKVALASPVTSLRSE